MRTNEPDKDPAERRAGVSILARSIFRQMRLQGYTPNQIIGLSSELLQLVSHDIRGDLDPAE